MTIHVKSESCIKGASLHSKMENTVPTQVLACLLNWPSVIKSFPSRNSLCLCLLSTCTSWPRGKVYLSGLSLPFLSKLFISFFASFSWECANFFLLCIFLRPYGAFHHLGTCLYFPSTAELWQVTWSSR